MGYYSNCGNFYLLFGINESLEFEARILNYRSQYLKITIFHF